MKFKNEWLIYILFFVTGLLVFKISFLIYTIYERSTIEYGEHEEKIIVPRDIMDYLNEKYTKTYEQFWCIIGHIDENNIIIDELIEVNGTKEYNKFRPNDVSFCNFSNSLGSIHTHPKSYGLFDNCYPSSSDFYTWGNMKNPEPIIQGIYCGKDKILFIRMPKPEKFESEVGAIRYEIKNISKKDD